MCSIYKHVSSDSMKQVCQVRYEMLEKAFLLSLEFFLYSTVVRVFVLKGISVLFHKNNKQTRLHAPLLDQNTSKPTSWGFLFKFGHAHYPTNLLAYVWRYLKDFFFF